MPLETLPRIDRSTAEWPTMLLAVVIYGGWLLVTFYWQSLPLVLVVLLGGWLVAWQGSLQHEVMHGHPTRSRAVNDAIGWPPLSLWLPYRVYRLSHLRHHRDEYLTDPIEDPESAYVTPERWQRLGPVARAVLKFNMTLVGRLTVGPALMIGLFLADEAKLVIAGEPGRRQVWALHVVSVALVLAWLVLVCAMPLWIYLAGFVYFGGALTRLRSFAEHKAAERAEERTAIVENGGLLGLLYLNNNLHVLHHLRPAVAWYRLPSLYRAERDALVRHNGGLVYDGYGDILRRYFLNRHDEPPHPGM
ncbi:fatty acid desaturase [Methylobrevis albus]|uniref:Fatty acid desaturase n=1 Tax=Methylobrevis albus TaxID=2793297 RepID=A0A931HZ76_9HYPH|nr:fatty acid desaturase [Methylobrevis albus]MBH0236326.1 fatty acid desaturase [Methylobrevis albus]